MMQLLKCFFFLAHQGFFIHGSFCAFIPAANHFVMLMRVQVQKIGIGQKVITHYRKEEKGDIFS